MNDDSQDDFMDLKLEQTDEKKEDESVMFCLDHWISALTEIMQIQRCLISPVFTH